MAALRQVNPDPDKDLRRLTAGGRRHWSRHLCIGTAVILLAVGIAVLIPREYHAASRTLMETRGSAFARPENVTMAKRAGFEGVTSQPERIASLPGLNLDPRPVFPDERALNLAVAVPRAINAASVDIQREAQSAGGTTDWLEQQIAELRERVREAEGRLAAFQASSDLLSHRDDALLAQQQLYELSSELSRVRVARLSAEATAAATRQALSEGLSASALPAALNSPLIQRLRERNAELLVDLSDLSTTLLENHPRMRAVRSQLRALEAQIAGESRNILAGLDAEIEAARVRELELTDAINEAKAESVRAGEQEAELRALEREAAAERELLETYLTLYREASTRRDRDNLAADARIVSEAPVPVAPYFPNYIPIAIAAFCVVLLLVTIGALLRELHSGRGLRQPRAAGPGEPDALPIGAPPRPVAAESEAACRPSRSPTVRKVSHGAAALDIAAAARDLRAKDTAVALFVSPEGDEGAAVSVQVARELSDSGRRVVLLDLTAAGAASGPMLEGIRHHGITDLLAAEAQFRDIIHADYYSDCDVIPAGNADPAKAMRNGDRLPVILQSLTAAYDHVVVECGPADAAALRRLAKAEAQILVGSSIQAESAAAAAAEELREAGFSQVLRVTLADGDGLKRRRPQN